nr:MAG TPA: hypothetical protein [Caudoviricetes sp.]
MNITKIENRSTCLIILRVHGLNKIIKITKRIYLIIFLCLKQNRLRYGRYI